MRGIIPYIRVAAGALRGADRRSFKDAQALGCPRMAACPAGRKRFHHT